MCCDESLETIFRLAEMRTKEWSLWSAEPSSIWISWSAIQIRWGRSRVQRLEELGQLISAYIFCPPRPIFRMGMRVKCQQTYCFTIEITFHILKFSITIICMSHGRLQRIFHIQEGSLEFFHNFCGIIRNLCKCLMVQECCHAVGFRYIVCVFGRMKDRYGEEMNKRIKTYESRRDSTDASRKHSHSLDHRWGIKIFARTEKHTKKYAKISSLSLAHGFVRLSG